MKTKISRLISLRLKIATGGLLSLLLLAGALVVHFGRQMEQAADEALTERALAIASDLAGDCEYGLMVGNKSLLQQAMTKRLKQPDVVAAAIFNARRKLLASVGNFPPISAPANDAVALDVPGRPDLRLLRVPAYLRPELAVTDELVAEATSTAR